MEQARQNIIQEAHRVYFKAGKVYSKVNGAYSQSRPSGILFAQANGKLYFERLETFRAAQNHLPHKGGERTPKSGVHVIEIMHQ
jgi:hypothetical protein